MSENRGRRDAFAAATPFNQLEFIIERKIREKINTSETSPADIFTYQPMTLLSPLAGWRQPRALSGSTAFHLL